MPHTTPRSPRPADIDCRACHTESGTRTPATALLPYSSTPETAHWVPACAVHERAALTDPAVGSDAAAMLTDLPRIPLPRTAPAFEVAVENMETDAPGLRLLCPRCHTLDSIAEADRASRVNDLDAPALTPDTPGVPSGYQPLAESANRWYEHQAVLPPEVIRLTGPQGQPMFAVECASVTAFASTGDATFRNDGYLCSPMRGGCGAELSCPDWFAIADWS